MLCEKVKKKRTDYTYIEIVLCNFQKRRCNIASRWTNGYLSRMQKRMETKHRHETDGIRLRPVRVPFFFSRISTLRFAWGTIGGAKTSTTTVITLNFFSYTSKTVGFNERLRQRPQVLCSHDSAGEKEKCRVLFHCTTIKAQEARVPTQLDRRMHVSNGHFIHRNAPWTIIDAIVAQFLLNFTYISRKKRQFEYRSYLKTVMRYPRSRKLSFSWFIARLFKAISFFFCCLKKKPSLHAVSQITERLSVDIIKARLFIAFQIRGSIPRRPK